MQFIKRPFVLLYKGYKSSVNYDGEPSVSNGIMYQLPSFHLFIHQVLTKLSNRVMPYGENYCQLQLLFVFDCYRPSASFKKTVFQWTLSLVSAVGLVGNAVHFTLHPDLRVPYPEPCSISDTLWNPARLWNI